MRTLFIMILPLILISSAFGSGNRYYVIPSGSDGSAGTSWATAFQTFRHADSVATSGDTIWVAAGTYTPAASNPSAYFQLKSGVAIYGGFAGTETALNQRNWQTNVTTLSGGGTSHTIVYSLLSNSTAVLDGFVVSGGNSTADGAGINLLLASPTLSNLTITGNSTTANGGGLCNNSGSPTITNCSFTGNNANYGGGMYNYAGGVPVISGCIFRNNGATTFGGGFYNTGNTLNVQGLLFDGNHATTGGGGIYEDHGSVFLNLTFHGNTSKYGGGIFVTGSSATITNSILWNDTATTNGPEIYNTATSGSTTISYTLVEGGVSGSGLTGSGSYTDGGHNQDQNPLFTDTSAHDFTLTGYSPAIDSGTNAGVTASTDLAGDTRISHGNVDIGAYEYQGAPLAVELTTLTATQTLPGIEIRWTTATELDNYGFEIQRSVFSTTTERLPWTKIGFVRGAGTSSAFRQYSFIDADVKAGAYSYRVKQIDQAGLFTYSKSVVAVVASAPQAFTLSQNYPNPFNPTTTIQFSIGKLSIVSLRIYDVLGREVETLVNGELNAGTHEATFDASRFASGVYIYRLESDGISLTRRLVLLK